MGGSTVPPFAMNVALYIFTALVLMDRNNFLDEFPTQDIFRNICFECLPLQRSDVFLECFQLATHVVSCGGAFEFWSFFFSFRRKRGGGFFSFDLYSDVVQADTKKEQK